MFYAINSNFKLNVVQLNLILTSAFYNITLFYVYIKYIFIVRSCASLKNYIIIIIIYMLHVYIYIIFRISLSRSVLERHITRPFGILIFRWRANASAESL